MLIPCTYFHAPDFIYFSACPTVEVLLCKLFILCGYKIQDRNPNHIYIFFRSGMLSRLTGYSYAV